MAEQSEAGEERGGDTRMGGAKGERAREARAHAAGVAMDGRRSTLNRRRESATNAGEDDAQTGKDAQRECRRCGSKGEGSAGEKRSKEQAAARSVERKMHVARRPKRGEKRAQKSGKNGARRTGDAKEGGRVKGGAHKGRACTRRSAKSAIAPIRTSLMRGANSKSAQPVPRERSRI